jgi:hypothetical protein
LITAINKISIITVIISILLIILFQSNTPVMASYNTTDIDVNISQMSQITLYPNYLNWTQVVAGAIAGYKNVTLQNTGSVSVNNVFAWVDTLTDETSVPYGSSDPASYAAGGVLVIRNETDSKYYYIGRLEWNWTADIPNHNWGAVTSPIAWGYFRNITNNYVWVLGNGTEGRCNESSAQFSIETDIDTGGVGTRTPDNTFSLTPSSNDAIRWSYAAITTGTLAGHCIAAYWDCSKVYITKFDKRTNFTGCANQDYFYDTPLNAGNSTIIRLDAWIPSGIPSGNLTRATLTVEAS